MKSKMATDNNDVEDMMVDVANGIDNVTLDDDMNGIGTGISEPHDTEDLPTALIITNVDLQVFEDPNEKANFERIFKQYEDNATFAYLKNFRRARVNYSCPIIAAAVGVHLKDEPVQFCGKTLKCYFAQPPSADDNQDPHLHPPMPEKMFLISPPASPPVDWEPVHEGEPVVNYDLLNALANLAPGEAHEVHPGSDAHPAIIVHVCEDPVGYGEKPKIVQTRRPERNQERRQQ